MAIITDRPTLTTTARRKEKDGRIMPRKSSRKKAGGELDCVGCVCLFVGLVAIVLFPKKEVFD